jgi:hypothetical protein
MTAPPSLQHGAVYSIYSVYAVDAERSTNMRQCTRVGHLTSQQQVGTARGYQGRGQYWSCSERAPTGTMAVGL